MCAGNISTNLNSPSQQISRDMKSKRNSNCENNKLNNDILSTLTYYTKVMLILWNSIARKIQDSNLFKLLGRTTQPAHLVTLVIALILAKILSSSEKSSEFSPPSTFLKLIYVGSFACHLGFQIWMTFISGLSLYLCLPRHAFGDVQKVLFPKYFLVNAVLSFVTLCSFMKFQDHDNENDVIRQIVILVICFTIELTIRLYMTPRLLKLMTEKNLMEIEAGVGTEIGQHDPGCLVNCPVYVRLHSSFRKVHMTIAIGNMITMACTAMHLYYLSDRIII